MEQDSCERQALFFPARQGLVPRSVLIKALDEVAEFDFLQDSRNLLHTSALGGARVGHGATKRAHWQIRPLRQNQQLRPGADLDIAVTPAPRACQGAGK